MNAAQNTKTDASIERLLNSLEQSLSSPLNNLSKIELAELFNAGQQALIEGRLDDALGIYLVLQQARPDESAYRFGYALTLQQMGEIKQAGEHYTIAFALDPTDAACAFRLGECLAALGYTVDAHDALHAAIQLCDIPRNDPKIRELADNLIRRLN